MGNSVKLLKLLFVILLLITIGELGILFIFIRYSTIQRYFSVPLRYDNDITISPIRLSDEAISRETTDYLKNGFVPGLENLTKTTGRKFMLIREDSGFTGKYKLDNATHRSILTIINDKGAEVNT